MPGPPTSTIPEGALDLVAPAGVFPPGVITGFEAASGCQVAMQPWPATEGMGHLLGSVDLVSVRADRVRALAAAGLVVPVDSADVEGMGSVASRLRSLQAVTLDDHSYAVPYAWAPLLLLSRDDAFPDGPPTSLRVLWEPARSTSVAVPDTPLTLATAALSVGVGDPFSLVASDLAAADELVRLARPAYRWSSNASLESLLGSGLVDVALGPARVAIDLRARAHVSATIPVEGAVGLVHALAIAARAPHPVCAYRFLTYMLQPQAQASIARATGLTPVVQAACRPLGPRRCAELHANDQWGASVRLARRPLPPAAPWSRWVADWRALPR